MPVRTRKNRKRAVADVAAWECVFSSEFDFFGELADAGVETDAYGRPDLEEARTAWQRFGPEFMAAFTEKHVPWALREFGDPRCPRV
ncbi:MAG: hypothetical protein JHD07_06510 [Bradyrhizobium sp.]|uniref:hypothetical protein n=1 Tax=Bradyrhizobium sp. TaxID=376 RepID=UPI001A2229BE|nr:hypothetical protein [Bradyrhizobium sp.]MBJ7402959.1 hypothetical protein [Bradyrhizobium sp.]